MPIGKQIRDLRRNSEFDFTRQQIFEVTGVSKDAQHKIETGKTKNPLATTLQRLMKPYEAAGYELRYIHGEFCIVKKG